MLYLLEGPQDRRERELRRARTNLMEIYHGRPRYDSINENTLPAVTVTDEQKQELVAVEEHAAHAGNGKHAVQADSEADHAALTPNSKHVAQAGSEDCLEKVFSRVWPILVKYISLQQ